MNKVHIIINLTQIVQQNKFNTVIKLVTIICYVNYNYLIIL